MLYFSWNVDKLVTNIGTFVVLKEHRWERQILHIWASHSYIADIVASVYEKMEFYLRFNTIVMITVSKGNSSWLYTGDPSPLPSMPEGVAVAGSGSY